MTSSACRRAVLTIALGALGSTALAPEAAAQRVSTGAAPIRYYRGLVGMNPLGIPFDIFAVEAEGAIAPGITAAGALSYFAPEEEDPFTSGDVKLRYYPGETALDGFSVGLGAGFTRRGGVDYSGTCVPTGSGCDYPSNTATGPTVSVMADYNFLLGQRRRFLVGTGVGAKRWMVDRETRESVGAERAWVYGRFLIGLAF